jgi:hypothetical protein
MAERFFRVLAIAVIFGPVFPLQAAVGQEFDTRRVLAEWDGLAKRLLPARYVMHREYFFSRDGAPLRLKNKDIVEYKCIKDGILTDFQTVQLGAKGESTERGASFNLRNRHYTARLKKSKTEGKWSLIQWKPIKEGDEKRDFAAKIACPWLVVGNVWLPDFLGDDSFVIQGVQAIQDKSPPKVIRVSFRVDPARRKSADAPEDIRSGSIDFDPECFFRPTQWEFNRKSKSSEGIERGVLTYENEKGVPILKAISNEVPELRSQKYGTRSRKEVFKFQYEHNAPIADLEFRLSYYGIPEPDGIVWETPSRWYLWFIGIAAVSLIVGFYLVRRSRRPSPAMPASGS